jgi:hypothetical protein
MDVIYIRAREAKEEGRSIATCATCGKDATHATPSTPEIVTTSPQPNSLQVCDICGAPLTGDCEFEPGVLGQGLVHRDC